MQKKCSKSLQMKYTTNYLTNYSQFRYQLNF